MTATGAVVAMNVMIDMKATVTMGRRPMMTGAIIIPVYGAGATGVIIAAVTMAPLAFWSVRWLAVWSAMKWQGAVIAH